MSKLTSVLMIVGVLLVIGILWSIFPMQQWLDWIRYWIQGVGAWGVVAFVILFSLFTLVMVPVLPLTITAGLVYGIWGFPLVIFSATIAACIAFLISRYLMHDTIGRLINKKIRFRAVNLAISEEGWKIVFLMRLSPVLPFSLQNYLLGITDINFISYAIASFFGVMPSSALFIYVGSLGTVSEGGLLRWIFLAIGGVTTAFVVYLITRRARQAIIQIESGLQHTSSSSSI